MKNKLTSLALLFILLISLLGAMFITAPVFAYSSGKITFRSASADYFNEIFIMNADGSNRIQLTYDNGENREPCLSPDGSQIVYSSSLDLDGKFEIWKINADGTGKTQLTDLSSYPYGVGDGRPSWSPDGAKIVFESSRNVWHYLYIMNADGSGVTMVNLPTSRDYQWPSFSPDGTKLLFYSNYDNGISTSNLDGSGLKLITTPGYHPAWSPDGSKIVFYATWPYPIYTIDIDGSHKTNIGYGVDPSWSPDGNYIAYCSTAGISVMGADGTDPVAISTEAQDQEPSWGADYVCPPATATITIVKNTLTVTDTFGFTGTGGNGLPASFTINPVTPTTFSGGGNTAPGYTGSQTYVVAPGSYTITESELPADWSLYSSVDQYGVETLGEPTVTVTVTADEEVTIEFYNSKGGEPGFPLPELPSITLLGFGLTAIGGFILIKRQIGKRQRAH
jgi:Tol biopolymer transport system component